MPCFYMCFFFLKINHFVAHVFLSFFISQSTNRAGFLFLIMNGKVFTICARNANVIEKFYFDSSFTENGINAIGLCGWFQTQMAHILMIFHTDTPVAAVIQKQQQQQKKS